MGSSSTQAPPAEPPEPVFTNPSAYRAPHTPQQETLCALFAQALDVTTAGLDDSFFDLAGQSLNGIRLINLINKHSDYT